MLFINPGKVQSYEIRSEIERGCVPASRMLRLCLHSFQVNAARPACSLLAGCEQWAMLVNSKTPGAAEGTGELARWQSIATHHLVYIHLLLRPPPEPNFHFGAALTTTSLSPVFLLSVFGLAASPHPHPRMTPEQKLKGFKGFRAPIFSPGMKQVCLLRSYSVTASNHFIEFSELIRLLYSLKSKNVWQDCLVIKIRVQRLLFAWCLLTAAFLLLNSQEVD